MKILIVQDTDWIQRNPIQHTHLAERLSARGHEIRVIDYEILWQAEGKRELFSRKMIFIVSRIMKDTKIKVIRPGILKIPILDYVSMLFSYSKEINIQIKKFNPDIIIGNDILTPFLAYKAARRNKIPTVFYAIDIEHLLIPFKFLQPIGKLIEKKNIADADLVISINEGLREYTIRMGARPERTLVIRAGVDLNRFNLNENGKEMRKKYNIGDTDRVLLFVGWLYHFSGLKEVLKDFSLTDQDDLRLLIVGDGDAFNELKQLIDEHNLHGKVILTGKQPYDSIPKFIASADICLLPAYNNEIMKDIVPIKMYDYMSMGKPIIATKLPGIFKEFGEGNGIIYINGPEDAMNKARELVNDLEKIKIEGIKSRKYVENYSWESITDTFEFVLNNLLKNNDHLSK